MGMIRLVLLIVGLFFTMQLEAQTGIGTSTPNSSAKLDVFADNKGFLPPRVSLSSVTDQSTIPSPATGLLVYCKGDAGLSAGYYYWNGNAWATIATAGGSGSFASSFLRGSRSTGQTGLTNGGTVIFNQVDNSSGQDMSLNTSTGQITLAAGRTYRLMAQVPNFQTSNGETRLQLAWYNETTGAYIGSSSSTYPPLSGAAYGATGGLSEVIITTTTSTVVSYRILQLSNASQLGGSGDFNTTGSYPWFEAQVISGNAPITGQSVDYVSVRRSGSDQTVNSGDVIIFNTIEGGNIPYNTSTGLFSLSAGKTYKLLASVSLSNGNGVAKEVNINWKNADGDVLGSKGEMLSPSANVTAAGGGIAYAIYTPRTNTTVGLYVNFSSSSTMLWQNFTFASIEQIGSTAIINPWILSGTNTYNSTGNVGIGNTSPSTSLHIENGNAFGTDPSNTTSPSLYVLNSNNTSTSAHATALIRTAGNGGGNPYLSFDIMGVRGYSMGIDNADADKFKIHTNWNLNNTITPAITITTDARLGIGTTNPSAPLHVASNVSQYVGSYGYLNTAGANTYTLNGNTSYSIQSDTRIRASEFNAISDIRIKKDIVKSNTSNQLSELNKLKVVNYKYIDNLVNGNNSKMGFIAQEVESVKPQFVNISSEFIPSFFALANSANLKNNDLQVTTLKPHGFEKGDLVKFFVEGKKEVVKTIEEVFSANRFSIKGWNEVTNNLFIYGKKVNDFRAIDFDQITALSVGSIQELSKKVDSLEIENEKLKKIIKDIEEKLSKLSADIQKK